MYHTLLILLYSCSLTIQRATAQWMPCNLPRALNYHCDCCAEKKAADRVLGIGKLLKKWMKDELGE